MAGQIISEPVPSPVKDIHTCLIDVNQALYNVKVEYNLKPVENIRPELGTIYECSCGKRYVLILTEYLFPYDAVIEWRSISRWRSNIIIWWRRRKKISDSENL